MTTTIRPGPRAAGADVRPEKPRDKGVRSASPRPAPANTARGYLAGARWPSVLRECAGLLRRELRLALTPLVSPDKWVFVVGCYNSGTDLLTSLLGAQREIAALPHEGQFLTDQFLADYELGLPRMWALREDLFRLTEKDAGPDVTRLKKEWLMRLDRKRSVFLEKSPPNSARTRWLQHNFENAHFVAIVRNGYAVAEGIRRKAEPFHLKNGWPLQLCAQQWNRTYEVLLEDSAHLNHFTWLRYEDLVDDPATELNRILEFLGIQNRVADFDSSRPLEVHERNEPLRNMNPESINRMTSAELGIVTGEAERMLRHFGYPVL